MSIEREGLAPAFQLTARPEPASWDVLFGETSYGPFGSVFGGVIAGLMADAARAVAGEGQLIVSAFTEFLRPTAPGTAVLSARVGQAGRRLTLVEVDLHQGARQTAQGRIALTPPVQVAGLPTTPVPAWCGVDPADIPPGRRAQPRPSGVWSGDLLDSRVDVAAGVRWFTRRDAALLPLSNSAFAIAMADYTAGSSRPDSWENPLVQAFPNPNLFVSLMREPVGPWVGLRPESRWGETGVGLSRAELFDAGGVYGSVEMVCLLLPFENSRKK
jgi:acyl-coenzyme A thioesterase PaaI-like protein